MRVTRTMAYLALAAAAWMIPAAPAMAGKPSGGGGGSTGGGTIWYQLQGDSRYYTMSSDGSGKALAPAGANFRFSTHGGHRWYVSWNRIGAETYPNGNPRIEAFAVRDDGVSVQLTNQADLQRRQRETAVDAEGQRFAWIARRFVSGVVAEGGLYVATLSFDASGNVVGLASQPTSPAFARPLDANSSPDVSDVSWSPDGSQFAYGNAGGIDVADLSGNDRVLVASSPGRVSALGPQWSPVGSSILYFDSLSGSSGDWYKTSASGGASQRLIRSSTSTHVNEAFWSPTASHVVYTEASNDFVNGPSAIYRIPSGWGVATLLTSGIFWSVSAAWTQ